MIQKHLRLTIIKPICSFLLQISPDSPSGVAELYCLTLSASNLTFCLSSVAESVHCPDMPWELLVTRLRENKTVQVMEYSQEPLPP